MHRFLIYNAYEILRLDCFFGALKMNWFRIHNFWDTQKISGYKSCVSQGLTVSLWWHTHFWKVYFWEEVDLSPPIWHHTQISGLSSDIFLSLCLDFFKPNITQFSDPSQTIWPRVYQKCHITLPVFVWNKLIWIWFIKVIAQK